MHSAKELHSRIETVLKSYLPLGGEGLLEQAEVYSLEAGGKRLRPCILLAVCEMLGGDLSEAVPFAVALEYIHTYSLIHDDLPALDNDDMRRGKPSNHKVFGEDMAILAGDALLTRAFGIMSGKFKCSADSEKGCAAYYIASCAYDMVLGQTADIRVPEDPDDGYFSFVHKNKTAALFEAAFTAGAMLAYADDESLSDMTKAGKTFGLAFQLKDDISDMENEENYAKYLGKEKAEAKVLSYLDELRTIIGKYSNNEVLTEILGI